MRVVLDQFFDRNEYFPGDSVRFAGFELLPPPQQPEDPDVALACRALSDFVNRPQGHEIVELGRPNDQGFYNDFSVLPPGVLDQGQGRVLLDERMLDAVRLMSAEQPARVRAPARVLNASLQATVALTLGCVAADAPAALRATPT
jgi:hypothetical protein